MISSGCGVSLPCANSCSKIANAWPEVLFLDSRKKNQHETQVDRELLLRITYTISSRDAAAMTSTSARAVFSCPGRLTAMRPPAGPMD